MKKAAVLGLLLVIISVSIIAAPKFGREARFVEDEIAAFTNLYSKLLEWIDKGLEEELADPDEIEKLQKTVESGFDPELLPDDLDVIEEKSFALLSTVGKNYKYLLVQELAYPDYLKELLELVDENPLFIRQMPQEMLNGFKKAGIEFVRIPSRTAILGRRSASVLFMMNGDQYLDTNKYIPFPDSALDKDDQFALQYPAIFVQTPCFALNDSSVEQIAEAFDLDYEKGRNNSNLVRVELARLLNEISARFGLPVAFSFELVGYEREGEDLKYLNATGDTELYLKNIRGLRFLSDGEELTIRGTKEHSLISNNISNYSSSSYRGLHFLDNAQQPSENPVARYRYDSDNGAKYKRLYLSLDSNDRTLFNITVLINSFEPTEFDAMVYFNN